MIRSLLWKEWREQRWKILGIFAAYLALAVTAGLVDKHSPFEMAEGCIFSMSFLVPGFVAMGTITQERARRTDETLRVLPVSGVSLFVARFLGGIATMFVPLLVIQAICWTVYGRRTSLALVPLAAEMGLMLSLYLWTLVIGARARSEAALGLLNVGLLCACGFIASFPINRPSDEFSLAFWRIVPEMLPTGFALSADSLLALPANQVSNHLEIFILQTLELIPLVALACWRMQLPPLAAPRQRSMVLTAKTRLISRAQSFPVLWKTWREARMLVVGFIVIALCFMACAGGSIWWGIHRIMQNPQDTWLPPRLDVDFFIILPGIFSFIVVIILAVDIGMRDFENRLENFWQSRPIRTELYIAKRYLAGFLLAASAVLVVPALGISYALVTRALFSGIDTWGDHARTVPTWNQSWYSTYPVRVADNAFEFLILFAPQAFLVYGVTVLFATFTRRRVISMVYGVGAALALQMLFESTDGMHTLKSTIELWPPAAALYAVIMLAATALLGWLSVLSVKHDWRASFERNLIPQTPLSSPPSP